MKVNHNVHLKVIMTDKNFYIFNPKIASRFLEGSLVNTPPLTMVIGIGDVSKIIHIDGQPNPQKALTQSEFNDYLDAVNKEWSLILNKKSKKDVVMVYRDPMKRFTTAIIQDLFTNHYEWLHVFLSDSLFLEAGFTEKNLKDYKHILDKTDKINWENYNENIFIEMCTHRIVAYINSFDTIPPYHGHFTPHNIHLVQILNYDGIDKNKIKLFNLDDKDNQLAELLIKTEEVVISKRQENPSYLKKLVANVINEFDPNHIHKILYPEVVGYQILKQFNNKK